MGKLTNGKWFEVFRAGKHKDSQGRIRQWTTADLDKAVSTYNPREFEAPLVVGHPKSNHPAWGWAEAIKRVGDKLFAKPKQLDPVFAEAVNSGRYKNRSISFYPSGSIRHIGFLGAQPPAVKGLGEISFNEGEEFFEYEEPLDNTQTGEGGEMPKTVEEMQRELDRANAAKTAAEAQAQEYAEQVKKEKERADKAAADFAESESTRQKKEIADFVEAGIKDGKILPAWKKQGLANFMEHLAGIDGDVVEIEFCEGDTSMKVDTLGWFKNFISIFSEHGLFKEMVKLDEKTGKTSEFAEDEKLGQEIAASVSG